MKETKDGYTNHRSTEQRQHIMEILQQADRHQDADEIYRKARWNFPRISLSTVYRTLQVLKEMGLVEEHQFGSRRYYELPDVDKHHHMVCIGCGRVFEFKCSSTDKLKSRISKEEGFKVIDAEVRLAGYCPDCQKRMTISIDKNRVTTIKQEVK
jgi:Fur family ferric uptake transcriptional regulator